MAPKSKQTHLKNTFILKIVLASSLIFAFLIYLWRKSYNVLVHSRKKNDTNWWIVGLFSTPDGSISTKISISQKQFYFLILNDITEDLSNAFIALKDFCMTNIVFHFTEIHSFYLLSITTIVILLLSTCYRFSRRSCSGSKRKGGKSVKQTKSGVENSKRNETNICISFAGSAESGCHGNRTYYWRWLTALLFVAFLFSLPWEFVRLYQSMIAEKVTHMTTGIPAECVPDQMSMTQSLKSWLRWHFSWSADPCLRYHKALLIDPFWEVSPLMVISSALSHCIIYPIEVLLGGLGRALRLFFMEIPSPWQPIMLIIVVVFLLLTLIMLFGYRIHLPLLLKFEPKTPVYLRVNGQERQVELEKQKRNLYYSIESSQERQSYQDGSHTLDSQKC